MFAKTKTFSPMRTIELGLLINVLSLIVLLTNSNAYVTLWSYLALFIGIILVFMDSRFLKEDWEVKEIEERWAEKKRAREQRRLHKQNGKAKH